jgi:DNA-binding NtrC family response regulator
VDNAAHFWVVICKTPEELEKSAICATFKSISGNKTEAAKVLGIAYSTLYEKIKKYGMRE